MLQTGRNVCCCDAGHRQNPGRCSWSQTCEQWGPAPHAPRLCGQLTGRQAAAAQSWLRCPRDTSAASSRTAQLPPAARAAAALTAAAAAPPTPTPAAAPAPAAATHDAAQQPLPSRLGACATMLLHPACKPFPQTGVEGHVAANVQGLASAAWQHCSSPCSQLSCTHSLP